MEHKLLRADLDGVPGIVAPLIAGDNISGGTQDVDNLALALIAPLCTDDHMD